MRAWYVFLMVTACCGMEDDGANSSKIDAMIAVLKSKYEATHKAQVLAQPSRIGGIKAVVSMVDRDDLEQESQANNIIFSGQEIADIYAGDQSLLFVSVYENNGALIAGSTINTVVSQDFPVFVAQRMVGQAAAVGLQKDEHGTVRVVRTICLNIQDRWIKKHAQSKPRFESEDEQWDLALGYFNHIAKKPSRLIRDKHGNYMLDEASKKQKSERPDLDDVDELSDQSHLLMRIFDAFGLGDEGKEL